MEESIRNFGHELGRKALAKDWPGVHQMLAPWLRRALTVDQVRAFFEDAYRSRLQENGIEGMHYPGYPEPEVGGNGTTNATDLRKPISFLGGKLRPVPPEVTDEIVRYWLKVDLLCSDEQMEQFGFDSLSETWISVVETEEGLRVGYWSQGAY